MSVEEQLQELRRLVLIAAGRKLSSDDVGAAHRAIAQLEARVLHVCANYQGKVDEAKRECVEAEKALEQLKLSVLAAIEHECEY